MKISIFVLFSAGLTLPLSATVSGLGLFRPNNNARHQQKLRDLKKARALRMRGFKMYHHRKLQEQKLQQQLLSSMNPMHLSYWQ